MFNDSATSSAGLSRFGFVFVAVMLGSIVFVCYQVFPFYYYYWEIEGLMLSQADKAYDFTDAEIRNNILQRVRKLEIPLDEEEDLNINRFDGKIVIDLRYSEVLYLDWGDKTYDLYVFKFNPHVEKPISGKKGS